MSIVERVPFRERAQNYRTLSARARLAAHEATNDDARRSLMLVAASWESLADSFDPSGTDLDRIFSSRPR